MLKRMICIALVCGCAGLAAAQPGGSARDDKKPDGETARALRPQVLPGADIRELMTFKNELQLTAEQVAAIHQMRADINNQVTKLTADMAKPQKKLGDLLAQPVPDFMAIHAAYREIADITYKAQSLPLDAYETAYRGLTENQKNMLAGIRMRMARERALKRNTSVKQEMNERPDGMPGDPEGTDVIDNGPEPAGGIR